MTCDKQYLMGNLAMYCNHICLIQRNYSATKITIDIKNEISLQ